MNLIDIADARAALAARLEEGSIHSFDREYADRSAKLDQLTAAARLRLDAEAAELHKVQVDSAIAANRAIAANQGKFNVALQAFDKMTAQNADNAAALRELVRAVRDASIVTALGKLWKAAKR